MSDPNRRPAVAEVHEGGLTVRWSDKSPTHLPNFWLRDNCRCAKCRHPGNGQKLYEIVDLPADLAALEAMVAPDGTVKVLWSDGHRSEYGAEWLNAHDLIASARIARQVKPELWGKPLESDLPVGDWPQMLSDPAQELAWLDRYAALGFGLLRNVPAQAGMVAEVGDHLGFVRVTNYGRLFDVISVPNPNNLANTSLGLGVHSDNPYRHPSPGVQLLHCLEAGAPGGDTLLVDGFHAAEILRRENPGAFALLSTVPMTFRFSDDKAELEARQTLITADMDGVVTAVHFNNRSADWLDAPIDLASRWYAAYRTFAQILKRAELEVIFKLGPGDLVVMQNDRALHGRTAFDPNLGRRHLQGCYIDRDGIESRRRILKRRTTNRTDAAA
ncbi:TauD/TfdA family dioxygenase [Dongia sp.]|uniref:2-trimethylaminoethylphosphonate dioxygenase n=1 Tax=Dongia sp. TaxID=1977262 RepID=UPI0037535A06